MIEWHALEKNEVLEILKTSSDGLAYHEATSRLKKHGPNEIKQISKINPLTIFLQQFKSLFILILVLAALFSLFIKHYVDFSVILAIVMLNSLIGFFQQYKAEKTIMKMLELLVPKVKVLRQNILYEIPSTELVPGDVILISEGDKIMADCRILHENELQTNEAVLTGESFPQTKSSTILKIETELADRENMLYMGTTVVRGQGKAVVVATGMNTEFGKIAGLVQHVKIRKTPLEEKFDIFAKKISVIVLLIAAIITLFGFLRGEELFNMLLTGTALAVSVIPEGLPAVIAITLALAIGRMQKVNALIRKLPAAETLGRTTTICVDKTGTITEEEMTVTKLFCNNQYYKIQNNTFFCKGRKIDPLKSSELIQLLKIGIMCNNARIEKILENGKEKIHVVGDPTEKALVISADKAGLLKKPETEKEPRVIEYSFSSKRKLMSIVRVAEDSKFISYIKGAPDIIIKRCTKELVNGKIVHLTLKRKAELVSIYNEMASEALRVLGFAFKILPNKFNQEISENELVFVGFQGMIDPPRKEVAKAIKDCITAGISVKMLTGDSLMTAVAISNMIGLDGEGIEGHQLEKLSEEEFDKAVKEKTIFARITPEIKLKIIQSLKKQKEIVAVTGDGINDVLALKEAHISVAMGIRGTDVAREASDIILLDDNFSSIVNAVREGRKVYDNMKKSIKFNLAANAGEMFIVAFAMLLAMPLPLMPLAILWMNLITDSLPSLSLSVEKEEENIMKRKPIDTKEDILKDILAFIIVAGLISFIATLGMFVIFYQENLAKARTIALSIAVFCELFLVFSCRSSKNIWKIGVFSNKFLVFSVATAFVLQLIAIYTPLAKIFGFVPLSFTELVLTIAVSSIGFIVFELAKLFKIKI